MKSRRQLLIFLNNKLISLDTILPLAMEISRRAPWCKISFVVTSHSTYEVIQANSVLYDALRAIGTLTSLGRKPGRNLWVHRLRSTYLLAGMLLLAALDRAVLLHFKALNKGLLNLLYQVNRSRVYFCENDSYGFTKKMYDVTYYSLGYGPPMFRIPKASHLIAFSRDWPLLQAPEVAGLPVYRFGATRTRRIWLDYVRSGAGRYFAQEFRKAGLPEAREIIAVMLGYFGQLGYMRSEDSVRLRLRELLAVLLRHAGDRPIFLKPHPVTDLAVLREEMAALGDPRLVLTYLHPMVLAQRAVLFAANYYTTTLGDAVMLGIPTIEYTDYADEALAITHGSMRPEFVTHFVNGDPAKLDEVVRSVLTRPRLPPLDGADEDPSGLITHLVSVLDGNCDNQRR